MGRAFSEEGHQLSAEGASVGDNVPNSGGQHHGVGAATLHYRHRLLLLLLQRMKQRVSNRGIAIVVVRILAFRRCGDGHEPVVHCREDGRAADVGNILREEGRMGAGEVRNQRICER